MLRLGTPHAGQRLTSFSSLTRADDSWYCIWDSFRVTHPLYAIVAPIAQSEMVRALIDIWRHDGWLPDCRMSSCPGYSQGGANAETLLADSYVKGIHKGVNWTDGLQAVLVNSDKPPPAWNYYGRGGINERKQHGFIPVEDRRNNRRDAGNLTSISSMFPTVRKGQVFERGQWTHPKDTYNVVGGPVVSRQLEYALNDVSVALIAAGEGREDIYDDYRNRSSDWRNIWKADMKGDGWTGFFQARYRDGSWAHQDPAHCSPRDGLGCYLGDPAETYEASLHQYSFFVPHDMAALIELMGGHQTFLDRLDYIWEHGLADIGDELSFLAIFSYNWAPNGYRRTVDRQLMLIDTYFNTTAGGIPGNDDSGATGALHVFFSLGFMPIAGTATYLLSTPLFPGYSIKSEITGATARVVTHGFDGATKNKYIIKAKLNGEEWTKPWFNHSFFLDGGTLELWLGPEPSADFGTKIEDLPPSFSTGGFSFKEYGGELRQAIDFALRPQTVYPDVQRLFVVHGFEVNSFLVFSMLVLVCIMALLSKRLHQDQEQIMQQLKANKAEQLELGHQPVAMRDDEDDEDEEEHRASGRQRLYT